MAKGDSPLVERAAAAIERLRKENERLNRHLVRLSRAILLLGDADKRVAAVIAAYDENVSENKQETDDAD